MKQIAILLVLLIVALCAATSFVLSLSADTAVATYAEIQQQEPSVVDIVMESRQTASAPPQTRQNGMMLGAGLFAVVIVFILGCLGFMFGGARFLREIRLNRRRGHRSAARPLQSPYYIQDSPPALPARYTVQENEEDSRPPYLPR